MSAPWAIGGKLRRWQIRQVLTSGFFDELIAMYGEDSDRNGTSSQSGSRIAMR